MPDYKIACPHCGLHISVTEQHAETRIACPTCQKEMKVPAPAPRPRAAPAAPVKAAGTSAAPLRSARAKLDNDKSARKRTILVMVGVVVGLGVALVFLWPVIQSWQAGLNKARDESDPGMIGGQMGHLAELNATLDATDPARIYTGPDTDSSGAGGIGQDPIEAKLAKLQPAQAVWSMAPLPGPLSEGRANGMLAGTNFLVESASILVGGASPILTLRQGQAPTPDRELMIYLRSRRGEPVEGKTVRVDPADQRPEARVLMRWQAGGAKQTAFAKGFALRLELGKASDGMLPGKLFLSLPDPEHSVVTGVFFAEMSSSQPARATGGPAGRDDD